MAIEGSSVAVGRMPGWLTAAPDIRFIDYAQDGNDTLIQLELPSLGAAAPELYEQSELWSTKPTANYTAMDVLSEVVGEVDRGDQDSPRYDRHLLRKLSVMRRVFSSHLQSVALPHGSNGAARFHLLTEDTTAIAGRLADSTPQPQEVRVAGQLDMIRQSTRSFGLQLRRRYRSERGFGERRRSGSDAGVLRQTSLDPRESDIPSIRLPAANRCPCDRAWRGTAKHFLQNSTFAVPSCSANPEGECRPRLGFSFGVLWGMAWR